MAITNNIPQTESKFGIAFNGAYYRIVNASVLRKTNNSNAPKFEVEISLEAFATNSPTIDMGTIDYKRLKTDMDTIEAASGSKFLDKCYAWVMTQMAGSSAV